jgi:hypothetical protein
MSDHAEHGVTQGGRKRGPTPTEAAEAAAAGNSAPPAKRRKRETGTGPAAEGGEEEEEDEANRADHRLAGKMVITTLLDPASLAGLQRKIMALPASLYFKNSRQPSNKGQVHLGWTDFSGPQTQAVCGVQTPYLSSSYRYLATNEPTLLAQILGILEQMWRQALRAFPVETATMLQTSASLRLGGTGFQKLSSGTDLAARWHTDSTNLANSVQCVLVLGVFQGGDVRFDVNGRTGKARSEHTASRGSEAEVVVVPNEHGTLFIGHYERLWHVVDAVTGGHRTILAAYATGAVKKFDDAVLQCGRFTLAQAVQLKERRVAVVKALAAANPGPENKAVRASKRKPLVAAWAAEDSAGWGQHPDPQN